MGNVPLTLPAPGGDSGSWGDKLNAALTAISGDYLSQVDAAGLYLSQADAIADYLKQADAAAQYVAMVAPPTGGDDAALLQDALSGSRDVYLLPGAVYTVASFAAWPAFSGRVHGRGAQVKFTYAGAYQNDALIKSWTDVVVDSLTFTAPGAQFQAIFGGGCARLAFVDCAIFDSTPFWINPITADLAVVRPRFYQSGSPPATIQQTVIGPYGGRFLVEDPAVEFAPTGAAGAIFTSPTDAPLTPGATIHVRGGKWFTSETAGYTIDAAIDVEPYGAVPYDLVEISGTAIHNAKVYLSGAKRINVADPFFRFTDVSVTGHANKSQPFVIRNARAVAPPTGIICITRPHVMQDDSVNGLNNQLVYADSTTPDEVHVHDAYFVQNGSASSKQAVIEIDTGAAMKRLVITGPNFGQTAASSAPVIRLGTLPTKVEWRGGHVKGTWSRIFNVFTGASDLVLIDGVDVRDLTLSAGGFNSAWANTTAQFTAFRILGCPGWNPTGVNTPAAKPAIPATGAAATNGTGVDCTVLVAGGNVTQVAIGGTNTGLTSGFFRVPAGQTITLTYTVAPTWTWFGD